MKRSRSMLVGLLVTAWTSMAAFAQGGAPPPPPAASPASAAPKAAPPASAAPSRAGRASRPTAGKQAARVKKGPQIKVDDLGNGLMRLHYPNGRVEYTNDKSKINP